MERLTAEETLIHMIELFKFYLEELQELENNEFVQGEKTAYVEGLEIIQRWILSEENGLDFDIEKRFPLSTKYNK